MEELLLPEEVRDAERAMELARIWVSDNRPTFVVSGNLWDNPATWGLLLVDFMKHVSTAYAEQGRDAREVMDEIQDAFIAELNNPTS